MQSEEQGQFIILVPGLWLAAQNPRYNVQELFDSNFKFDLSGKLERLEVYQMNGRLAILGSSFSLAQSYHVKQGDVWRHNDLGT